MDLNKSTPDIEKMLSQKVKINAKSPVSSNI